MTGAGITPKMTQKKWSDFYRKKWRQKNVRFLDSQILNPLDPLKVKLNCLNPLARQ